MDGGPQAELPDLLGGRPFGASPGPAASALPTDPEAVAREINRAKPDLASFGVDPSALSLPPLLPPEGGPGWTVEPPERPQVTVERISVSLPAVVHVWYDWARQEGWRVGDGSLSAFVTDCLLDHFRNCWGKMLVVADARELNRGR